MKAMTARHCGEPACAWLVLGLASCGLTAPSSAVCSEPPAFTGLVTCAGTGRGGSVVAEDSDTSTDIRAEFWAAKLRDACQAQTFGACIVTSCSPTSSSSMPTQARLQAGDLTFTIGHLLTFTLPPDSGPSYSVTAMPGLLFAPGARLSISATGGTFPAFSTSICEEGRAMFTSPNLVPNVTLIDRGQDLGVKWEGPAAGVAEIEIDDRTQTDGPLVIKCDFPLDAGTGTIPKEALTLVNPGQHPLKATQRVRTSVIVGDACVDVEIAIDGLGPGRSLYSGQVSFM